MRHVRFLSFYIGSTEVSLLTYTCTVMCDNTPPQSIQAHRVLVAYLSPSF